MLKILGFRNCVYFLGNVISLNENLSVLEVEDDVISFSLNPRRILI